MYRLVDGFEAAIERAAERVRRQPKPRPAPHTHEPSPDRTGEQVWHLPGKIPISQIRALAAASAWV